MGALTPSLFGRGAILLGCAFAALCPVAAEAHGDRDFFSSHSLELGGDIRFVAVSSEKSWLNGGFGKLRSGGDGRHVEPELGNVSLAWTPQLTWSLGATVVGRLEGGQHPQAGLSQAYLRFRPMRSNKVAFSARAGLMWPPVSLEHEGSDWHVRSSITPSAINSWIGEEVKPLAVEGTLSGNLGDQKLRATAALITRNDTAGTLLTFRGWALHDRTTIAFNRQPLPPLGALAELQAPYTDPLIGIHEGQAKRIGYYGKLTWQLPVPVRIELFRYDNRASPEDVSSAGPEWGWRTRFNHIGLVADLGSGIEFKSQALQGATRMGFPMPVRRWVDERFRAAYAMINAPFGKMTLSMRGDLFDTRARGSIWSREYGEHGWAAMASAKRDWSHLTGLIELLHVWSNSPARENAGEGARVPQSLLQVEVRMHW